MLFDRLILSHITPVVFGILGALLTPSVAFGATMKMDVSTLGKKIGVLDVSTYNNLSNNERIKLDIIANFTKDGIEPGGQEILEEWFPQGLTYMQTMTFMFDSGKTQTFFRDFNGNILKDTWSDPPQMGYTFPGGQPPSSPDDSTPWYSTIEPTMVAGDIPPSFPGFGNNQFRDRPMIPFADFADGTEGLLSLLDGKDGMWNFETTLVGVKEKPTDDPETPENEEKTGKYKVVPLKTFTWGFNLELKDGEDGDMADEYDVTVNYLRLIAGLLNPVSD